MTPLTSRSLGNETWETCGDHHLWGRSPENDLPMKKALTSIQPLTVVNRYININLAGFLSVLSVFTSLKCDFGILNIVPIS
jgi:hypothetical protein